MSLERSGNLLESGIYDGNHYGTPKPQEENPAPIQRVNSSSSVIPGIHPSSEGKRRRNRSSVEAMTAKTENNEPVYNGHANKNGSQCSQGSCEEKQSHPKSSVSDDDDLGPLPENWEKAFTDEGEPYFIDHNSGTSQWLDPRPKHKKPAADCDDDELPYGWEKIDDPQYGTYFIDHVNKRTQYENPVVQARQPSTGIQQQHQQEINEKRDWKPEQSNGHPPMQGEGPPYAGLRGSGYHPPYVFTEDPSQLEGKMAWCRLVKGPRGLGFTIIGGDDQETREFLQIKGVIPGGPACLDGTLQTGDVLVYINDRCVLGSTHQEAVSIFQAIPPGEEVSLGVSQGYCLPFDPNDPHTTVLTTSTVHPAPESQRSAKSMPDLSAATQNRGYLNDQASVEHSLSSHNLTLQKPEFIAVEIVKGTAGFGFTIADSVYGQKVKKILDRNRCMGLAEGDVLVEINSRNVRGLAHAHVVQMLKDCPIDRPARIHVHRHPRSVQRMKSAEDIGVRRSVSNNSSHSYPHRSTDSYGAGTMYRSKTPTAELYSSREKEVISRPKTPLVDTRHWPPDPPRQTTANHDSSRHSVGGEGPLNRPNTFSNGWRGDQPPALRTAYSATLDKTTVNPSWYTTLGKLRDTYWANDNHKELNKSVDFSTMNHSSDLQDSNVHYYPQPKVPPPIPTRNNFNDSYEDSVFSDRSNPYPGQDQVEWNNEGNYARTEPSYPRSNSLSSNGPYNHTAHHYGNGPTDHPDFRALSLGHSPNSSSHYDSLSRRKRSTNSYDQQEGVYSTGSLYSQEGSRVPANNKPVPVDYVDMTVTLHRQESGFGFRIVGGTEEGSQVAIGHIVPGGSADVDGRVHTGDEILTVDGQSVMNTSHHRVVQLIGSTAHSGRLTLGLRRRLSSTVDSTYGTRSADGVYPYDVTVHRQENEGFGFVIISSVNRAGATIGRIIEGSPADRCGQLRVGDRILSVNGGSILNLHHGETVNLIKDSGLSITLTIGPPDSSEPAPVEKPGSYASSQGEEGEQYHALELQRGAKGFGFSIRGGREFQSMPLFVLRIAPDGPAHQHGKLMVGDQIIEINGKNTKNMTHAQAIELIRQGNNTVRLLVRRNTRCPPQDDISVRSFPQQLQPMLTPNGSSHASWGSPYEPH